MQGIDERCVLERKKANSLGSLRPGKYDYRLERDSAREENEGKKRLRQVNV